MSAEWLPLDLDSLSVVARTEIRDVRLVGVTAKTDDVLPAEIDIEIRMTRNRYRVENGSLYVRTAAEARYLTRVSEPDTHAEDRTATETDQWRTPGPQNSRKRWVASRLSCWPNSTSKEVK